MRIPASPIAETLGFSTSSRFRAKAIPHRHLSRVNPVPSSTPKRLYSPTPRRLRCRSPTRARRSCDTIVFVSTSSTFQVARDSAAALTTPQHQKHLQSQISPILYLVSLLLGGALFAYNTTYGHSSGSSSQENNTETFEDDMEALPGRPGNLTPEQEEKLRKFWEMFFHIAGTLDDEAAGEEEVQTAITAQGKTATAGSEKPKKKRMSLFKRKKDKTKEEGGSNKVSAMNGIKENDPEDKWGENKAYFEALATHSPEQIRVTLWSMVKHDNPDALLLRFIRARKWDLQRALVMLISTMSWRSTEMHVDDDIIKNGEEWALENEKNGDDKKKKLGQDFLAQMRLGKSFCYGVDKTGRPITVVRARLHRAGEQSEESLERYTVYLIETARLFLTPPVDTACIIFDMAGFSLANMDYNPVKFMIKCFEANYPESLGVVLVHKSPWVFQGVWKIIRGWLDPVVASKVHFTNNMADLEEFIAPEEIPADMDGRSSWTYGYVEPVPGENSKMNDTEARDKLLQERETIYDEYEAKTIEWINEVDAARRASLQSERNAIAKSLKDQYWRLDPYVRSRSLYDRTEWIKQAPSSRKATTVAASATTTAVDTSADDVD